MALGIGIANSASFLGRVSAPAPVVHTLTMLFDDISNADLMVGDSSDVADWNVFFDLPSLGTEFSSVSIDGDEVVLRNDGSITLKMGLFVKSFEEITSNTSLLHFRDTGCIIACNPVGFFMCISMTDISMPECTELLEYDLPGFGLASACFADCSATSFYLPKLVNAGAYTFAECYMEIASFPMLENAGVGMFVNSSLLTEVNLPSLISAGDFCFKQCPLLLSATLGAVESVGTEAFSQCTSINSIYIPSCTSLGPSTGNNNVFNMISARAVVLTVPISLQTCNTGAPDGDIVALLTANPLSTVTYV
jgi:hypothetical protein